MDVMCGSRLPITELLAVVMVEVDFPSQRIQAMDLVKHINPANMSIGPEPEAFWKTGGLGRIGAQLHDIGRGEWNRIDIGKSAPSFIDRETGFLPVYRGRFCGNKGSISFDLEEWYVYLVKDWCCKMISLWYADERKSPNSALMFV